MFKFQLISIIPIIPIGIFGIIEIFGINWNQLESLKSTGSRLNCKGEMPDLLLKMREK